MENHFNDVLEEKQRRKTEGPRPLMRELPPAPPFPVDALGTTLSDAAKGIHDKVQAPVAICGQSVLAAATLAAQSYIDVQLPMGSVKPSSNFFMTVAASGERKSACDSEALAAVKDHEKILRRKYDGELHDYQNRKLSYDAARKAIVANRDNRQDPQALESALAALGLPPSLPQKPIIICAEPTFEGLCRLFIEGRPGLGIFSSEGGQFINGHGMSADNKMRTATGLSLLWDGEAITRVRAVDGSTILSGRRCTAHLMAQPDVAAGMLGDSALADQGLLSRMLVTAPESTAGTRLWREPQPESAERVMKYKTRMLDILALPQPLAPFKDNELEPAALPLSPAARAIWIRYANHVERKIIPGGEFEPIRGLANKLPEHAARNAAVLGFFENPMLREISAESMDAGIELADHYAAEALRLFGAARVNPDLQLAQRLLAWLHGSWREPLVSLPDIYQRGLNAIRDKETAHKMVGILEAHGWLVRVEEPDIMRGTRRREIWKIERAE